MRRMYTDEEIKDLAIESVPTTLYVHHIIAYDNNSKIKVFFTVINNQKAEWTTSNFFTKLDNDCNWSEGGVVCSYNTSSGIGPTYVGSIGTYDDYCQILGTSSTTAISFNSVTQVTDDVYKA